MTKKYIYENNDKTVKIMILKVINSNNNNDKSNK